MVQALSMAAGPAAVTDPNAAQAAQIQKIRQAAEGFERAVVERVARLIRLNEYKRRQAPLGIRVTHRSFGKDWRYPITARFRA